MRTTLFSAVLAAGLGATGFAMADEPMTLTDAQMDGVSAGATAASAALAASLGDILSETATFTSALAVAGNLAQAQGAAAALGVSVFFPAAASVASTSAASLP